MTERRFIQPPEIVDTDDRIIFLAGPIQGAPEWQPEAAELIHDIDPTVIVASPRRDYEKDGLEFVYDRQVDWETTFLRRAGRTGAILFWLAKQATPTPGREYAQTTSKELFEWKVEHKYAGTPLVVGFEDEATFGNARYIRRRFEQDAHDVAIVDSLAETCRIAVELSKHDEPR